MTSARPSMRLEKSRSRCSVLFQSETMQRKTPGRNSHYIGNKEQKHICHNKSEKTMDSRKTLTGCGLSLFYSKKIYCAAAGTKNGKSVFKQPLVSFIMEKAKNPENACFLDNFILFRTFLFYTQYSEIYSEPVYVSLHCYHLIFTLIVR